MNKFLDYLKYSGVNITFRLNPFTWTFVPVVFSESEWARATSYHLSILFLDVHVWTDDGSW